MLATSLRIEVCRQCTKSSPQHLLESAPGLFVQDSLRYPLAGRMCQGTTRCRFFAPYGAYFGTTFPHLFMLTFPECIPKKSSQYFVPRVFGFRIHKSSPYYADSALSSSQVKRRQKPLRRAKSKPIVL
mmetsp:Transcript_8811/g.22833  ORF Transcript_8811/g.22833 Transcript_8811/m.22833 type:complete len:128 (-) Transcript_8811:654-1037(-)